MFYLLDDNKKPYPVSINEFGHLYDNLDMKVTKKDTVGDIMVSTVFLGIDHGLWNSSSNVPVLWETMIFGGEHDGYQERYTSHEDALAGHQRALDLVVYNEPEDKTFKQKSKWTKVDKATQKEYLTDIMEADQKDGLYEDPNN